MRCSEIELSPLGYSWLFLRLHHEVMQGVLDQLAQGFVKIHGPGGCDRSSMKNPSALRPLPIDDLGNRLVAAYPGSMPFSIEIEDVAFALTTGDGDDAFRFDQPFQHWVLGCPQQVL